MIQFMKKFAIKLNATWNYVELRLNDLESNKNSKIFEKYMLLALKRSVIQTLL